MGNHSQVVHQQCRVKDNEVGEDQLESRTLEVDLVVNC